MKNLRFTFIMMLSLTIFYSCDQNENMIETEVVNTTQEELTLEEIKSNDFDFNEAKVSVFGENPLFYKSGPIEYNEIRALINQSSNSKEKSTGFAQKSSAFEIFGPYDIYTSATKIYSDRKLFLSGIPGLASGVYFCDVYNFPLSVSIPTGAVGRINSATTEGYVNFTTQVRGFNQGVSTTPSGTFLNGNTYYLYVKYNILGQQINRQLPQTGQTVKFNYEYITW
jgi:hypothetical protein